MLIRNANEMQDIWYYTKCLIPRGTCDMIWCCEGTIGTSLVDLNIWINLNRKASNFYYVPLEMKVIIISIAIAPRKDSFYITFMRFQCILLTTIQWFTLQILQDLKLYHLMNILS